MLIHKRLAVSEEEPCGFEVRQCVSGLGPALTVLHRPVSALFHHVGEEEMDTPTSTISKSIQLKHSNTLMTRIVF